ncbi:hypothetical protein SAMN03159343_0003 [Klenkia marina]|uniref:SAV-6107-like HEPN domain-containing protein n=1 Tax=Klenkia marina TaxID=1960309 RepID=A0A1G4Z6A5_9ACTN|nr:hypothetical protein [Klenkia marina]SCX60838.1 hypothetical protein SAMN03159343_0003 [Klenkia marina]
MSTAEEGRRRAEEHLALVAAGRQDDADAVLGTATDLAAITYLGAAFTALSRSGARELSPAQRAQATGRHMRLSAQRDAAGRDPQALRPWLHALAREAALVQEMQALAAARAARGAPGADGGEHGADGGEPVSGG